MCQLLTWLLAPLISFGAIAVPTCEAPDPAPAVSVQEVPPEPEVGTSPTEPEAPEPTPEPERFALSGDALAVADCESGNWLADGSAERGSGGTHLSNPHSTASGWFHFLDGTWEWVTGLPAPASAYPLDVQLDAFEKLWDDRAGMSHWEPSRSCWARAIL